ncbi:MAG: HAD-IC family P-type ATPase [Terriglobales bacterium]
MPDTETAGRVAKECELCGLPCGKRPHRQRVGDEERAFCCLGCMNVYLILSESCAPGQDFRETELFKRSLELGLISQGESQAGAAQSSNSRTTTRRVAATDSSLPSEPSQVVADATVQELLLQVQGMWCTSCAWLIEYAVHKVPGVTGVEASFASDIVKVKYQPQFVPPDRLIRRIESLGYTVQEFRAGMEPDEAENRALLLRVGIAAFLWMNVMYLSMTLYISFFENISDSIRHYVPFFIWALATPVIFYCGYPILRLAWRGLVNGAIRMEALLSLGILTAYFFSIVQAFRGDRHIYFDTACVIVTLVLAGKLIERSAKGRASRWITLLHRMMPNKARLLVGGQEHFVSIEALEPGQVVVVKAGERIPVDGTVVDGESHADESLLTGESTPVAKQAGDATTAGSVNLDGVLHIRALRTASESTLAGVVAMVEHALSSHSPIERIVDRVSRVFVPCVVVAALLTFGGLWWWGGLSVGSALMRAISVLVIACPCALGMATPLAITAAMGAASRQGILFRDGGVLEGLRKVDAVVLDKTGTITEGNFSALDFEVVAFEKDLEQEPQPALAASAMGMVEANFRTGPMNGIRGKEDGPQGLKPAFFAAGSGTTEVGPFPKPVYETSSNREMEDSQERDEFRGRVRTNLRLQALSWAASIEQYSEHPLGRAFVALANEQGARLKTASAIEIVKGQGILGEVEGKRIAIGNRKLLKEQGIGLTLRGDEQAQRWEGQGKTVAFLAWDREVQGMAAFGDRVRRDAADLVDELKSRGIVVHVVSGDSRATTKAVALQVGADHYEAEVLPEQKAEFVRRLQSSGAIVAMVGDGINDAPALAQADLGVAMGSGTDIAMKAAAVVLMKSSLRQIPEIFNLSARTIRIIKQNLFWAFFYNTLGISLAIAGVLNPIMAAAAMLLSSVSVVGNSLRLAKS